MAANWELMLVLEIARRQDLQLVLDRGVKKTKLANIEARTVFEGMLDYFNDHQHYGEVMGEDLLRERFSSVDFPEPSQSLEALCTKVRQDHLGRSLRTVHTDIDSLIDDDPEAALAALRDATAVVQESYHSNQDVDFAQGARQAFDDEYRAILTNGGMVGLHWPWPELTKLAGPIEPENFVVVYGTPKSRKTWYSLYIATNAYEEQNARVMIYSREMSLKRLRNRVTCLLTKTDYERFTDGKLTEAELDYLRGYMDFLEKESKDLTTWRKIIFTHGMNDTDMALPILRQRIEAYRPNLVMLDSAYQLTADADWKKLSVLTRGIKDIARDTKTPIIAVTQENEKLAYQFKGTRGTASVGKSPSWVEDADQLMRVVYGDEITSLHVPAQREKKRSHKGIRVRAGLAHDMGFVDYAVEEPKIEVEAETPRPGNPMGSINRPRTVGRPPASTTY